MDLTNAWLSLLPNALRTVWSDAIPDCLLDAWWARGRQDRVLQLCGLFGPRAADELEVGEQKSADEERYVSVGE